MTEAISSQYQSHMQQSGNPHITRENGSPTDSTSGVDSGSTRPFYQRFLTWVITSTGNSNSQNHIETGLPTVEPSLPVNTGQSTQTHIQLQPLSPRFLLLCHAGRRRYIHLLQPDLASLDVNCDRSFFTLLRKMYKDEKAKRGVFRNLLSWKRLEQIHFVQFENFSGDLVEIRKVDDVPPDTTDYDFERTAFSPPIGKHAMVHCELCTVSSIRYHICFLLRYGRDTLAARKGWNDICQLAIFRHLQTIFLPLHHQRPRRLIKLVLEHPEHLESISTLASKLPLIPKKRLTKVKITP